MARTMTKEFRAKEKLPKELEQGFRDTDFKIDKGVPLGVLRARYGVFRDTLANMDIGDSVVVKSMRDIQGFYRAAHRMKKKISVDIEWRNSEYPDEIRGRLWRLT